MSDVYSKLSSLPEDAGDALNAVDCDGLSPLQYCYRDNHLDLAQLILLHPKSGQKVSLENADSAGRTLLHRAAEEGNVQFWSLLTQSASCELSVRDDEGNTPLMSAVIKHQSQVVQFWLEKQSGRAPDNKLMTVRNKAGHNLFMLVLIHLETDIIRKFIDLLDLSFCIDQCDHEGNNGLLITARAEKWDILKIILENNKIEDLAIDVHPTTKEGHSTLVLVLLAFVKLEKKILNFEMKNDKVNLNRTKQESESLWEIVRILLEKERDIHGTNPVSSKEAGIASIKQQLESSSQIKSPLTEEVLKEFTKLYKVKVKQKKKPEPVPEPVKEEPKKVLPVSSFQQKMNEIYKAGMEAEKKKTVEEEKKEERKIVETKKPPKVDVAKVDKIENNSANNPKNLESEKILNLVSVVEKKVKESKPEVKTKTTKKEEKKDLKELEDAINEEIQWAYEQKRISKEEEDKKNIVKDIGLMENSKAEDTDPAVSTEEPSLEEIRSRWKTKKPKTEVKTAEIDVTSIFEDIARKAEEKVSLGREHEGKVVAEENNKNKERDLEEAINEEVQWAYEQKRMMREETIEARKDNLETKSEDPKLSASNIMDLISQTEKKVEEKKKEISEKKEDSVSEKKKDSVPEKVDIRKENSTKKERPDSLHSQKSSNLAGSVEKTIERKKSEIRIGKPIEKENDLEEAINEEIQWAYEQKRLMKEDLAKPNGVTINSHNHNTTAVERNQTETKKKIAKDDKAKTTVDDLKKKASQEEEEILTQLAKKAEEKILKEKEEINKARQLESEKKRKEKELGLAISEEILWANEQKKLSSTESLTPPAPARRRRTGSVEEQEPTPPVPNRRRLAESDPSPSTVETCNGQRSLGVGVDTRPGYTDASTQTDPVQTCDFAV